MRQAGLSRVPSAQRNPNTARIRMLASSEVRMSQWSRESAAVVFMTVGGKTSRGQRSLFEFLLSLAQHFTQRGQIILRHFLAFHHPSHEGCEAAIEDAV